MKNYEFMPTFKKGDKVRFSKGDWKEQTCEKTKGITFSCQSDEYLQSGKKWVNLAGKNSKGKDLKGQAYLSEIIEKV